MKSLPWWKFKREVKRLSGQIGLRFEVFKRFYYEHKGRSHWSITDGAQEVGPRVAIFMLFQPNGIAASTFLTLDYLRHYGFSILIVSNAKLHDEDRAKLAGLVWRIIERPNFGYDFGAYRDSVLYLREENVHPDHLVLMNDSTWFPLSKNSDALDHVLSVETPFYGLIYKTENVIHHRRSSDHMESHFLSFRKPALESAAFKDFWTGYKMSNSRNRTIQIGEKGISRAMEQAGFTSKGMISHDSFMAHVDGKTNRELHDILQNVTYHRKRERIERDDLVRDFADTAAWRSNAMDHFQWCLDCMQYFVSTAFICVTLPEMGLPFVKKAREDRFHLARVFVLENFSTDSRVEIDPIILNEIATAVENYTLDPERQ